MFHTDGSVLSSMIMQPMQFLELNWQIDHTLVVCLTLFNYLPVIHHLTAASIRLVSHFKHSVVVTTALREIIKGATIQTAKTTIHFSTSRMGAILLCCRSRSSLPSPSPPQKSYLWMVGNKCSSLVLELQGSQHVDCSFDYAVSASFPGSCPDFCSSDKNLGVARKQGFIEAVQSAYAPKQRCYVHTRSVACWPIFRLLLFFFSVLYCSSPFDIQTSSNT